MHHAPTYLYLTKYQTIQPAKGRFYFLHDGVVAAHEDIMTADNAISSFDACGLVGARGLARTVTQQSSVACNGGGRSIRMRSYTKNCPKPNSMKNGDLMTDIRYNELLNFYNWHAADATMAERLWEWQHPFGLVQMEGVKIKAFAEKPISSTHINAGVYALSPFVLNYLDEGETCDMPALFERIRWAGQQTIAHQMHEPLNDFGLS